VRVVQDLDDALSAALARDDAEMTRVRSCCETDHHSSGTLSRRAGRPVNRSMDMTNGIGKDVVLKLSPTGGDMR
jgi:hypothetical protein